jgi:GYF domain 2
MYCLRHSRAGGPARRLLAVAAIPVTGDPWYYADNEQAVGPFSLADLTAKLQKLPSWKDLLVWGQDSGVWQRAGSCKEILVHFATPAPQKDIRSESPPAQEKSSRWPVARIVGGMALIAIGVAIGASWTIIDDGAHELIGAAYKLLTKPPPAKSSSVIEEENAKALAKLRAELPKKIDETTTLTGVKSEGTKFIYENRVAIDDARVDDATKGKLRRSVSKNVCEAPSTRRILDLGGSFRYVYTDIAGKPLITIDVGKNDCT